MFNRISNSVIRWLACSYAVLAVMDAPFLHAETMHWNNPAGGLYLTAANWTISQGAGPAPPTAGDFAAFNLLDAYAVTLPFSAVASDAVDVFAGDVTFQGQFVPGTYNVTTGTADVTVRLGSTLTLGATRITAVTLNVGDDLVVASGGTLEVLLGSDVTTADLLFGAQSTSGDVDTIVVDDLGSTLHRTGTSAATWGANGSVANLTYRNIAAGDINGPLTLVDSSNGLSGGALNVESGATLELDAFSVGQGLHAAPTGTVTVTGTGSTITQTGASTLTLGTTVGGNQGVLNVLSAGSYTSGTGTITVNATGWLNVDGGTFSAGGDIVVDGGTLQHVSGTFAHTAGKNLTARNGAEVSLVGSLPIDGGTYAIESGAELAIAGPTTINAGGLIDINGGTFTANGDIHIDGGTVQTSSAAGSAFIWASGNTMTIDNGGELLAASLQQLAANSNVSVTGGSALNGGSGLVINSMVTIDGAGSEWLIADDLVTASAGASRVNIQDGGYVFSNRGVIASNGVSAITVTGAGSFWENMATLQVGTSLLAQAGRLNIENGGAVSTAEGFVSRDFIEGVETVRAVTVAGAGSIWNVTQRLSIGVDSQGQSSGAPSTVSIRPGGTLRVDGPVSLFPDGVLELDGGTLAIPTGLLDDRGGRFDWISGTLNITGSDGLTVGPAGPFGAAVLFKPNQSIKVDNALTVEGEASLFSLAAVEAGSVAIAAEGRIIADGGITAASIQIDADGRLDLGGDEHHFGLGLVNHGDLMFSDPAVVDGPVTNAAGGAITALENIVFNGPVDGPGGFFGAGSITFAGGMSPGASAGLVSFEGSVHFSASNSLAIELNGLLKGSEYDVLEIEGQATLAGTLDVRLLEDFALEEGLMFEILTAAGGITGTFADAILPALAGNLFWNINYDADSVTLAVAAPGLPGDYNQDGAVDAADYIVWRKTDGSPEAYNTWRSNFGRTAVVGAASRAASTHFVGTPPRLGVPTAAVPEPAAFALLVLAGAMGGLVRRVRRPNFRPVENPTLRLKRVD